MLQGVLLGARGRGIHCNHGPGRDSRNRPVPPALRHPRGAMADDRRGTHRGNRLIKLSMIDAEAPYYVAALGLTRLTARPAGNQRKREEATARRRTASKPASP